MTERQSTEEDALPGDPPLAEGGITSWLTVALQLQTGPSPSALVNPHAPQPAAASTGAAVIRLETLWPQSTPQHAEEAEALVGIIGQTLNAQLDLAKVGVVIHRLMEHIREAFPDRRCMAASNMFYVTYDPLDRDRNDMVRQLLEI